MRFIINTTDGSVTSLEDCYLFDSGNSDGKNKSDAMDLWNEWVEFGSDSTAKKIALENGKELSNLLARCGYGDVNYGNTFAFSPTAIRDEINSLLDAGYFEEKDVETAKNLTDEDVEWIAAQIGENDELWTIFREIMSSVISSRIQSLLSEKQGA